jgi:hypothetical protein
MIGTPPQALLGKLKETHKILRHFKCWALGAKYEECDS